MSPRRKILPIFVPHAGCPNNCVFCNQKRISGSLFPASGESVRQEVDKLPPGAGAELAFYGGSFTAIEESVQLELLEAVQPARADGRVKSVRVSTRPDAIDLPTLARLRKYGVETVELGAQSLCDEVLVRSGRGHTAARVQEASWLIKAEGFSLILQMMTGLPGDTPERSLETARAILALKPDGVRIYPTVVVRDTPLEELWRRGDYAEHTVEEAVSLCALLLPLFEQADIPVIRLGLNPSEELSGGAAVAGAYHPAFGELVRSRILRQKAEELLSDRDRGCRITLYCAPPRLSAAVGQHRSNVKALTEKYTLAGLRVCPDPALQGDLLRVERNINEETYKEDTAMECSVAWKVRSELGEGVWWDDRREGWFWLDIITNDLFFLKDGENRHLKTFGDAVGFCAPCEDGRLVVGCGRDLLLYDPETGDTSVLLTVDGDIPANHFNDAKAIPGGRILAGTMNAAMDCEDTPGAETGRLYVLEAGKEPVIVTEGMKVPNGLAVSPDHKTAYHVDTYNGTIHAYDFDETAGSLSNRRLLVQVDPAKGTPDGMTIAEDGSLFVCHWGGHAVYRYDGVTGAELAVYKLPVPIPTCCCFGGKDMDELYITTSSIDSPEEEYPLAGSVLMIKPGVKGMKVDRYKL